MNWLRSVMLIALGTAAGAPALAQQSGASAPPPQMQAPVQIPNLYRDFEFLIGEWTTVPGGGPDNTIRQVFRWGPRQSYIFYTTLTREGGRPEAVHFEGLMVWNGATRALDYVIAVEPGSGTLESGTLRAEGDGSWVREVTMTQANGRVGHFRQTFRRTGADSAVTSLMRQTANGWEPNFPGSDRLVMTRRPA